MLKHHTSITISHIFTTQRLQPNYLIYKLNGQDRTTDQSLRLHPLPSSPKSNPPPDLNLNLSTSVGENIIGAPKMQNDYGVIFFLCDIAIGILNFFLLLLVQLSLSICFD